MKNNRTIKFETLYSYKYRIRFFAGVVCVVVLLVLFIVGRSHAKYRVTESMPLVNGIINYIPYDFKVIAMYQKDNDGEYEEIEVMPSSGYVINEEKSYCTVDGETKDTNALLYTNDSGEHVIANLQKKSKCYLYFDEYVLAGDQILVGLNKSEDRASGSITGPLTANTTGTVYRVTDDYGDSYVYAGQVTNNWFNFAGYYWRIIRINGDKSVRMIYNGTSTSQTGSGTQIQTNVFNGSYNDNAYVGYMYGTTEANSYSATHTNINNSAIKVALDTWYQNNILNKKDSNEISYDEYVSKEQGFCNDRRIATSSETWWIIDTKTGYGTNATAYAPLSRVLTADNSWYSVQKPILKCGQQNDYFTVSGKGNNDLIYPVGLITSDEVVLSGGWLYTGENYWTMSPYAATDATMFSVYSNGSLSYNRVNLAYGVRPVINLKADVSLTGTGTASDPYVVVGA